MPGIAQFWQTLRPLRKVGKLRGVITVPAFEEACGPAFNCLEVSNTGYVIGTAPSSFDLVDEMTIEAWVYPLFMYNTGGTLGRICNSSRYEVRLVSGGYVSFSTYKGSTQTLTSTITLNAFEWNHIACTYDGTTMRIYINGVLNPGTLAVAAPLTARATASFNVVTNSTGVTVCYNEVRLWSVARTQEELQAAANSPRNTDGSIDADLIGYWPLDEGTGTTIDNAIAAEAFTSTFGGTIAWTSGDGYPYKLGASYYPLQFAIATDGQYFSLKYPARKPYASVNFVPCIRWTEDGEVKRYRLWDAITGFDAAPEIPEYHGERIPAGSFLEIWNLDGNRTVLLTEAFDIETSILHVVENATTTARTSDATPVANTELAEPFPLTPFPLQFDTQQTF